MPCEARTGSPCRCAHRSAGHGPDGRTLRIHTASVCPIRGTVRGVRVRRRASPLPPPRPGVPGRGSGLSPRRTGAAHRFDGAVGGDDIALTGQAPAPPRRGGACVVLHRLESRAPHDRRGNSRVSPRLGVGPLNRPQGLHGPRRPGPDRRQRGAPIVPHDSAAAPPRRVDTRVRLPWSRPGGSIRSTASSGPSRFGIRHPPSLHREPTRAQRCRSSSSRRAVQSPS